MRADGEGGIWFYIILGLVGLIVSYLQNKAKPKQPPTTDVPDEPRDIWKELMDWDEVRELPQEEPKFLPKQPVKTLIEESTVEGPVVMDAAHEGVSVFQERPDAAAVAYQITEHPVVINENFIKDTEITDAAEEHTDAVKLVFNLRDAVIYSEILNRKY
ncbi:MAG: hypothetical protein ACP5PZ_06355 [Bacteroidales bacterium]